MTRHLVLFALFAAACGPLVSPESAPLQVDIDGESSHAHPTPVCKHVTASGTAFYNDQRTYGRFHKRKTPANVNGVRYKKLSAYTGSNRPDNYLGLWEATVKLYEVDLNSGTACDSKEWVGETTIASDGSWSWSGDVCDACGADDANETNGQGNAGVTLSAEISLGFCPEQERCFYVKNPGSFDATEPDFPDHGENAITYTLSYPSKKLYAQSATAAYGRKDFESRHADFTDNYAQAALVHASIVDATRKLHMEEHVSFKYDGFGDLDIIYPINFDYGASHSHESGKVCILAPGTALDPDGDGVKTVSSTVPTSWMGGDTPMHEYGHIVNYRAWDGNGKWVDYDYSGLDGEQDSNEYRAAAFKENWADFIVRVTLNDVTSSVTADTKGCSVSTTYDNDVSGAGGSCHVPTACTMGDRSPAAVEHALCDWYDAVVDGADSDSDPDSYGSANDNLSRSFMDIHDALERAWSDASQSERDIYRDGRWDNSVRARDDGLSLCEVATAWSDSHPHDAWRMDDLLEHNGILCN